MKLNLPSNIASSQDLSALLQELREYAKWFSHESIKMKVKQGYAPEGVTVSPTLHDLLKEAQGSGDMTDEKLDQLTKTLESYLQSSASMTLTLAAPAPGSLRTTLVAWCREHLEPNILVNFQFNSNLLGGMVVHYNSKVFDWSFRRAILADREKFTEILRHV